MEKEIVFSPSLKQLKLDGDVEENITSNLLKESKKHIKNNKNGLMAVMNEKIKQKYPINKEDHKYKEAISYIIDYSYNIYYSINNPDKIYKIKIKQKIDEFDNESFKSYFQSREWKMRFLSTVGSIAISGIERVKSLDSFAFDALVLKTNHNNLTKEIGDLFKQLQLQLKDQIKYTGENLSISYEILGVYLYCIGRVFQLILTKKEISLHFMNIKKYINNIRNKHEVSNSILEIKKSLVCALKFSTNKKHEVNTIMNDYFYSKFTKMYKEIHEIDFDIGDLPELLSLFIAIAHKNEPEIITQIKYSSSFLFISRMQKYKSVYEHGLVMFNQYELDDDNVFRSMKLGDDNVVKSIVNDNKTLMKKISIVKENPIEDFKEFIDIRNESEKIGKEQFRLTITNSKNLKEINLNDHSIIIEHQLTNTKNQERAGICDIYNTSIVKGILELDPLQDITISFECLIQISNYLDYLTRLIKQNSGDYIEKPHGNSKPFVDATKTINAHEAASWILFFILPRVNKINFEISNKKQKKYYKVHQCVIEELPSRVVNELRDYLSIRSKNLKKYKYPDLIFD